VVRHEASHLRHHHGRFLLLASIVEHALGIIPLVRRSALSVRLSVECWADEDSIQCQEDLIYVRSAILALLNTTPSSASSSAVHAMTNADLVSERLRILESGPSDSGTGFSISLAATSIVLGFAALASLIIWML